MNGLKQLRTKLGLTQEQISNYLGLARSAWSMAEAGYRDLPTAALVKLSQMEVAMLQRPDVEVQLNELFGTNFAHAAILLKDKIEALELRHKILTKNLETLIADENLATTHFKVALALSATEPEPNPRDKKWLELLMIQAKETLNSTKAAEKLLLQLDIEMNRMAIDRLQSLTE